MKAQKKAWSESTNMHNIENKKEKPVKQNNKKKQEHDEHDENNSNEAQINTMKQIIFKSNLKILLTLLIF